MMIPATNAARQIAYTRRSLINLTKRASFHFATSEYAACFQRLPTPDTAMLRSATLDYLSGFDRQEWFQSPIVSLLNGQELGDGAETDTIDGIGKVNGRQKLATVDEVLRTKDFIRSYSSPYNDLREPIRKIEEKLLTDYAGFLIGNQCIDFQKQDGVTEIEESIMANTVERRLNDLLLRDESLGKLVVNRRPIYVSAVSNFSNFLDLCRKVLRMLECGIPVVILGRAQVAQHSFRWSRLLVALCRDEGVDPAMVTFVSCSLDDIKDITKSCPVGNLYATCSRQLAAEIKAGYPKTIASTGGPNTMVSTCWDAKLRDAISCSAAIESAGQCTALRHAVVPYDVTTEECMHVFDSLAHVESAETALQNGTFAGVFAGHGATVAPEVSPAGFAKHKAVDAFVMVRESTLPPPGMHEYWRKVVADFTKLDLVKTVGTRRVPIDGSIARVSDWLNENQPISLAVNGLRDEAITVGVKLWEQTSLVVNTVGSIDDPEMPPALTCQARPQEGEVFGEFPPRASLQDFTVFPVIIPSSNPSMDAHYTTQYLQEQAQRGSDSVTKTTRALIDAMSDDSVKGYCYTMIEYLRNVCRQNPKQGFGKDRSVLWGLQRPPLGKKSILRGACWDSVAPAFVMFYVTNARDQVELSFENDDGQLEEFCERYNLPHVVESESSFRDRAEKSNIFQAIEIKETMRTFPMVGNYMSIFLPMGHIKSTKPDDAEFLLRASLSSKWLNSLF